MTPQQIQGLIQVMRVAAQGAPPCHEARYGQWKETVELLSSWLATQNQGFDKQNFEVACGVWHNPLLTTKENSNPT